MPASSKSLPGIYSVYKSYPSLENCNCAYFRSVSLLPSAPTEFLCQDFYQSFSWCQLWRMILLTCSKCTQSSAKRWLEQRKLLGRSSGWNFFLSLGIHWAQSGKDHSGIHEGFEWFAKANEDSARGWWDESPRGGKGLGRIWFNSVEMRRTQDRQSCLWILVSCFSVLPSISTFKMWTMLTVLTMLVYISVYRKALFIQKQLLPD